MPTIRAYWKAKDLGRCVECYARLPDTEFARCEKCREKRNRARAAYYARHRERIIARQAAKRVRERAERGAVASHLSKLNI